MFSFISHYYNFDTLRTGVVMGDVHPDVYTTKGTVTHLTPVPCGCGPSEMAVLLFRFAVTCGAPSVRDIRFQEILSRSLNSGV